MHSSPWDSITCIAKSLGDFEACGENAYQYDIFCWPQTWPNTACGFGGMAGQAITIAYTVVLRRGNKVYVYHNGRLAGEGDMRRNRTKECFANKNFPGARETGAWGEMHHA